jgi:hypothetical protein
MPQLRMSRVRAFIGNVAVLFVFSQFGFVGVGSLRILRMDSLVWMF